MRTTVDKPINALGWLLHGAGLACIAVVVAMYGWFAFMPLSHQQDLCQQRISQLESLLRKAPQVRKQNRSYRAELASLRQSVEETQRRLPKELREQEFVDQVRQVAGRAGMRLGEYQMGPVVELESYSHVDITFQCNGSYGSICQFLHEIDHLARITEISNLQIESGDNFHSYPLQVTFVLYFGGSTHDRSMKGEDL